MITGHAGRMTVRARQKLKTAAAADKFIEDLSARIQVEMDKGTTPSFDDFDVSQNPIPFEQFEGLINIFTLTGVRVERLRMFGMATLDDNVMNTMADWLRSVTAENAPHEMHLSDCAITADGFTALIDAIESNDAFPTAESGGRKPAPIYVRLENNYIQPDSLIQDKINEGVIVEYAKNSGPIRGAIMSKPDAKVKLLSQSNGKFQQRAGLPPAPQDAPAPKPVFDRYAEEQQARQGGGKGGGSNWAPQQAWPAVQAAWNPMQAAATAWWPQAQPSWQQPSWQQPQWQAQQQAQFKTPGAYGSQAVGARPAAVVAAQTRPTAFNAFNSAQQKGKGAAAATAGSGKGQIGNNLQRAADRSRTPAPRPMKPAPASLPAGWEEHFSDEYQIPYFWHSQTGESMWERPKA